MFVFFPARRFSRWEAPSPAQPPHPCSRQTRSLPTHAAPTLQAPSTQQPLPTFPFPGSPGEARAGGAGAWVPRAQSGVSLLAGLPAGGSGVGTMRGDGCVCTRFPRPRPPVTSRLPPPALRHRGRMLLGSGNGALEPAGAPRVARAVPACPLLCPLPQACPPAAAGLPSGWGCGAWERDWASCRAPSVPSGCHIGHVGGAGDCRAKAKVPVFLPKWWGFQLVGRLVFSFKNPSFLQGGLGGLGRRCRVLKTSMEEPLPQPALVLSKCRATRLFPPGSSTALSRVIKSQGMGSVLALCPHRCLKFAFLLCHGDGKASRNRAFRDSAVAGKAGFQREQCPGRGT